MTRHKHARANNAVKPPEIQQFSQYVQIRKEIGRLYRVYLVVGNQQFCVTGEPYELTEYDCVKATAQWLTDAINKILHDNNTKVIEQGNGCACVGVAIGSYANQVTRPIPDHMADYRAARVAGGLAGTICIDACLVEEIELLWSRGIRTTGCCCGHNQLAPYIGVYPEDIGRMKDMGYEVALNPSRPGDEDSFTPKSISER